MTLLIPTLLNLLFNQMTVFHWSHKIEEMIKTGVKGLKLMKENIIEVSPASAGIYNNFAATYMSIGDYLSALDAAKLALKEYEKLARINPEFMNEYLDFKERFKVFDNFPKSLGVTSKFKQIIKNLDSN